jgi:hypothetical protein
MAKRVGYTSMDCIEIGASIFIKLFFYQRFVPCHFNNENIVYLIKYGAINIISLSPPLFPSLI